MEQNFNLKIGIGESNNTGKHLKELGLKKPGLITYKKWNWCLGADFVAEWVYDLSGEPDYDSLDYNLPTFMGVDSLVAVGGGSVIDFAKGLAVLLTNEGQSRKYRGFPKDINEPLPVIAIPTTAGTGSEATYNAVFIDWKTNKKLGINAKNNFPALAILDPALIMGCPKDIMISSGMDILVHCWEGLHSNSDPLTKVYATAGYELALKYLPRVLKEPTLDDISKLQIAAYLGGLTLLGSDGGWAGKLSYQLGVKYKIPHGLAGGLILPILDESGEIRKLYKEILCQDTNF